MERENLNIPCITQFNDFRLVVLKYENSRPMWQPTMLSVYGYRIALSSGISFGENRPVITYGR
ncbi:hypothetical protein T03_7588 [Trichinella britovi]|uniref:Uncharacterized protein n=1 Tax=Trichinella britovi TaxID=45882 RepID=A0A0V1DB88_TRIBR|nr:hypothetical protein T03_7588 [Trichinella britovi]